MSGRKLKKNCKARNAVIRRLVEAGAEGEGEMKPQQFLTDVVSRTPSML